MNLIRTFLVTAFFTSFICGQTVDSVLFVSDPEFVFVYTPYNHKTANFKLTAYDANGQQVPEGVPISIGITGGILKGPTLFKSEFSSDSSSTNFFYFRTDAQGQIAIEYYPYHIFLKTYDMIRKNYLFQYPNASDEEIMNHYKSIAKMDMEVYGVKFQNPSDEQTAYWYGIIPFKANSVLPIRYSFNSVVIHGEASDGSPYIFTAENYKAKQIEIQLQALDMFDRPLPAGVSLWIETWWGRFYGDAITYKNEEGTGYYSIGGDYNPSFAGGGNYVVTLGDQGKAAIRYQAPPTTMVPFTDWANKMISYHNYATKEEAWKAYTSTEFLGWSPGTAVFYKVYGTGKTNKVWTGYQNTFELTIDSSKSVLPALVSVDKLEIETESQRNVFYVYASQRFSEKAKIKIRAFDGYGRLVPKGAPIALMINTTFPGGEKGIINGSNVVSAAYAGDNELCFIVRMGENGQAEVEYQAPLIPFRFEYYSGEDYKHQTYEDKYSGIFQFFPVPYYGWSWWGDTLNPPHWFFGYIYGNSVNPPVNVLDENSFNSFPVLVGPQQADLYFHPATLGPFKFVSKVNIYVKDHFGIPAPKGSNVFVSAGGGTLNDNQDGLNVIVYGKNGKAQVSYFSPTRSIWHTWSYDKVQVYQDIWGNLLAEKKIKLVGPAANWQDFGISKWLLGFDILDELKQLNPLKALGALKEFVNYGEQMAAKNREFFDKIYNGTATDDDFNAYEQRWQTMAQHIRHLAETIPNTSLTGPNLSAGDLFKGLATNGLKHTIINTLEDKLIKDPQKKVVKDFLMFHLSKFYPSESIDGVEKINKTLATYSYHIPKRMGKLELTSDLFTQTSTTGMYEMYGFKFRIHDLDSVVLNGAIQIGDQWPIDGFLIPSRFSLFGYPNDATVLSNGFFEITNINAEQNFIEGITIGYLFNDFRANPVMAFSKKVGTAGDTLSDVDGSQLIVPENAVVDSTLLFLVRNMPPWPFIENDQKVIQFAQFVGSMASDSTIQNVNFSVPAELRFIDSVSQAVNDPWKAYWLNEENQTWQKISGTYYLNDSVFVVPVTSTGVY